MQDIMVRISMHAGSYEIKILMDCYFIVYEKNSKRFTNECIAKRYACREGMYWLGMIHSA